LLDKPSGLTSNGALMRVKRLYNAEKAGHTGTLDPLASGLLPICFGVATRFAQFLLDAQKRYTATVRFGITTTTHDADGDVVEAHPVAFGRDALTAVLPGISGRQMQMPPAHSALKHAGKPYYHYARQGIDIPRVAREVWIHRLDLVAWISPDATLDVECSKGTYIRALAADLGYALQCGAHLAALRRTASGGFGIADAVTLERLEGLDETLRSSFLLPVDAMVMPLGRLDLEKHATVALLQGRTVTTTMVDGRYRTYGPQGLFIGITEVKAEVTRVVRLVPALLNSHGAIF
jgi:tRNA pseudouridine55 synthase